MARTTQTDDDLLQAAIVGYQHQLAEITAKIADVQRRLGGKATNGVAATPRSAARPKVHRISAEGRARIAAAQRKRWAAQKKSQA
jgi:hypothetical protein